MDKKKPEDKIKDFFNLPDEPADIIPRPQGKITKTGSAVENILLTGKDDDDSDLKYVKDIQKDLLAKGMEMIDEIMAVARQTNDVDAHNTVVNYIKELTKANKGLLDLNRTHHSTQEAKARTKKLNKDILGAVISDAENKEDDEKYTIRTTSSDMLKMVKELEEEEKKKKSKK